MNNEVLDKLAMLDKAIIENGGKWTSLKGKFLKVSGPKNTRHQPLSVFDFGCYSSESDDYWVFICTKDQFTQRAKELGFINGYRWGVECKTNGKRPDLADDCIVTTNCRDGRGWLCEGKAYDRCWNVVSSFKITDPRHKPADTSYLQTPEVEAVEEVAHGDLATLSIAISDAMNAAVDVGEVDIARRLQEINKDVLAEANKRKAELEKKRVVSEAQKLCVNFASKDLAALYDAGYLRLPSNKD